MDETGLHVFVSYSRVDQPLVTPIVHLLRSVGPTVFQDIDSIPHGKRWRPVIEESIDAADVVLVFWCEHSSRSTEVRWEWTNAAHADKDVVPIRLDDTMMDPDLAQFQAIDFRYYSSHHGKGLHRFFKEFTTAIHNGFRFITEQFPGGPILYRGGGNAEMEKMLVEPEGSFPGTVNIIKLFGRLAALAAEKAAQEHHEP